MDDATNTVDIGAHSTTCKISKPQTTAIAISSPFDLRMHPHRSRSDVSEATVASISLCRRRRRSPVREEPEESFPGDRLRSSGEDDRGLKLAARESPMARRLLV